MRSGICGIIRQMEPNATRPCYLAPNHGGEHLFIFRGQKVNEEGRTPESIKITPT